MTAKQIDIQCPCCNARLTVDVLTQTVLRHAVPAQVDETGKPILDEGRWASAKDKVANRKQTSAEKFDTALGKEQGRAKDLDDLFDKAKKKLEERKRRIEEE